MRWLPLACCSAVLFASSANAEWRAASSDHFVIYGDQSGESLRGLAERLELFHAAMARRFRLQPTEARPSPSNRVTIYVVANVAKVRELTKGRYTAGVYLPRAGSTVALVPYIRREPSQVAMAPHVRRESAELGTILYHEYAHHFMYGITARAYPRWFVEGFAESFAGVEFRADSISLGPAARWQSLKYELSVPIRQLLAFDGGVLDSRSEVASFYVQSWALFHYLEFAPERAGQLLKYKELLAAGDAALDAAAGAFGDLDQLERDMRSYSSRMSWSLEIDKRKLAIGPVNVRTLSPGGADMMPTVIRSKVGVTHEEAVSLLPEARRVAGLHPDDPAVLAALAEAEFDAGNDDAAIAAADRAIALDSNQIEAHIQKGYALKHKVETEVLPKESWRDVRREFIEVNRIENDHPIPLVEFYRSYLDQGKPPTKNAIAGLEWALQLAPFDSSVRWLVAQQMVEDNRLKEAAQTLAPLAYSPHVSEDTTKALSLLKEVEARIAASPGTT